MKPLYAVCGSCGHAGHLGTELEIGRTLAGLPIVHCLDVMACNDRYLNAVDDRNPDGRYRPHHRTEEQANAGR